MNKTLSTICWQCLFLLLMVVFVLPGCKETNRYKITVSEVAHSVFYAPFYVAINEGYFEEEGLDVEIILTSGADAVAAAVIILAAPGPIDDEQAMIFLLLFCLAKLVAV